MSVLELSACWSRRFRLAAHVLMYPVLALMVLREPSLGGKVGVPDALLACAALLWGAAFVLDVKTLAKPLAALFTTYWPGVLLCGWTLLSACFAPDKGMALNDTAQMVEYFIVAVLLFNDFLAVDRRRVAHAVVIFIGLYAVVAAIGGVQYFTAEEGDPFAVRSLFMHRNVMGGFMAMTVPLCFSLMCEVRAWWMRAVLFVLVAGGMVVTLSGAAYGAVVLALAGIAAWRGVRCFLITCAVLVLWQGVVMDLDFLPRFNNVTHIQSVALYDADGLPERRYPEWQVALDMADDNPLLGVGPGHYQRTIGQYYGYIPNPTGPSEPEIQNLYLVLLSTLGLPGLFAFLAVFVATLRRVARGVAEAVPRHGWRRGALIGFSGGLVAFAVVLIWHPLLVRGIGLPFVAMLVLCHRLSQPDPRNPYA